MLSEFKKIILKGKGEHQFHSPELFQKVCVGQRRYDSIFILALESIVTKARYNKKGMHFAEADLTRWSSSCALVDTFVADHITFPLFTFFSI